MDYDVVFGNLGTVLQTISVDAQQSSDLKSWESAIFLIGETGYTAYITITLGEQQWIRLMVYDPAGSLGN